MDRCTRLAPLGRLLLIALLVGALPVLAQEDGAGGAARDWAFIQKLLADGMQDVAAGQLEGFAAAYPHEARAAEALLRAGILWEELEQPPRAQAAYDALLRRHASSPAAATALRRKGLLLADEGRLQEAANVLRGVLSSYPASPEVDESRLALGEVLLGLEQYDDAGRAFRYLIGGRADATIAARALFDLGVLHQKTGADSLAIVHFDGIGSRYPDQPIAAFGRLRAANLLEARDPDAARRRYEDVVHQFDELVLKARARMGLAGLLEKQEDFKGAASLYGDVAEEGGTAEQVNLALLALARCELAAGRAKEAREAADALLQRTPESGPARLLRARAALSSGDEDAVPQMEALGRQAPPSLAAEAWSALGDHHQANRQPERALTDFARAAARAEDAAGRTTALLRQSALARDLDRPALSLELATEASALAPGPDERRAALMAALLAAEAAEDATAAQSTASLLLAEFPMSTEARTARAAAERWQRRATLDPATGWKQVTDLALDPTLAPGERAVRIARILRDTVGDLDAALDALGRATAETPAERSRVARESGITLEAMAREAAAHGDSEAARQAFRRARSRLADAAAVAEDRRALQLELLRLELADAVAPDAPWTFDAHRTPLVGGVGRLESVDLHSDAVRRVLSRMEGALESGSLLPAWVWWRTAELGNADAETRVARLDRAQAAADDPVTRAGIQLTRAQVALRADDLDAASGLLRGILEDDAARPVHAAARYSMAELHRGAQRYDTARELYDQFAGTWPDTRKGQRAILLAGDCALFLSDHEGAIRRYRDLLARDETSPYADDARYRLGTALLRTGDRAAARAELEPLSKLARSDYRGRSLEKLAEILEAQGDRAAAAVAWQDLLSADPELAVKVGAHRQRARLALASDDPEGAVRWLDRAPEDLRGTASHLELRVRAQAAANRLDDARRTLEQLAVGHPGAADETARARLALAIALEGSQKQAEASQELERALNEARDPNLAAEVAYQQGMLAVRATDMDRAAGAFAVAVQRAPDSNWGAEAYFKLGNIASREGRDQEARNAFQQLSARHPGHELAPQALRGLASSWRREGRYDQALETYHQLLERYPETPDIESVLSQIAYCHHEMGQYEVSIAAYQRVMPFLDEEGQGYAQFWIADSYQRLGRLEEAAAGFLRIPYLYPELGQLAVTAQLKAARVYEEMDRVDAAVRLYEKVLASHGAGSQWGGEAQKRLDDIAARSANDSR